MSENAVLSAATKFESQSRALSESFPAKKLRMGFERKTASEGGGIGRAKAETEAKAEAQQP